MNRRFQASRPARFNRMPVPALQPAAEGIPDYNLGERSLSDCEDL
jgi:hypothetical protein